MNIRLLVAGFYGLVALGAALHSTQFSAEANASETITIEPRWDGPAYRDPSLTGHAEIDDLPAYMTEDDNDARY